MSGKGIGGKREKRPEPPQPMPCEEIQGLLLEYMTRELGAARSDLVREHIRKCDACRHVASEIQRTLTALRAASRLPTGVEERLTPERHARLLRAFAHPVMNWITIHHKMVSIIAAIVAVLIGLLIVNRLQLRLDIAPEGGPTVVIKRGGPTNESRAATNRQAP